MPPGQISIVFGGPQVPDKSEAFLRTNPFIDIAVNGEGEAVFLQVLEKYTKPRGESSSPAGGFRINRDKIGSISYLKSDGTFAMNPKMPRIQNLSTIPSPYLEGIFDPLMRANPQERWLLLWETNRGCPFSCTFCDWGSATAAKVYQFDLPRLFQELDWMGEHKIEFVFCCDANYGILTRDLDITEYAVKVRQRTGYPQALSVQNTKNATQRAYKVQKTLADAGLNKGVTISLQSIDPTTLEAVKRRNISSDSFMELQRRFTQDSIETYSDMILGMPEETYDTFVTGIDRIIENGQHNRIQFNNLSILPNAEMGDPEYQKRYGMEVVQTKIINIHGSLIADEVQEYQELVIATRSMPRSEWRRTRAMCWMTALIYFDKILQMPLVLARQLYDISYRDLLEIFTQGELSAYPTLTYVRDFFLDKARDIQEGGEEYCHSPQWLDIFWPADELVLIHLCTENRLDNFYKEAEDHLCRYLAHKKAVHPALREAIRFNHSLVKVPFQTENLDVEVRHNIWEFYRAVIEGRSILLENKPAIYHIDRTSKVFESWAEWCQQVIWYGNKKGAYLYTNRILEPQLEGHF